MPISAQQWRVKTGVMNASKGFKPNSTKLPPSLFELPPPPPPDWKGYNTALVLVCLPLLCRIYAVGMSVMAHIARRGLGPCEYVSTAGSSLDIRTSYTSSYHQQSAVFLGLVFYLSMVIGVVFVSVWEYRERGKHHLKLIQPLPDVNFAWLEVEGGREGSVHVRPRMISGCIYAMIEMDTQSSLKCVRNTGNSRKRVHVVSEFTCVKGVSFALRWSTAVLAMLLLMAGDVERNPGPPPMLPDFDNLRKFKEHLTEFSAAAARGDVRHVSSILERPGIDVNFTKPETQSVLKLLSGINPPPPPLFAACRAGHLEVVRVLLKHKDIRVNIASGNYTPLSVAAEHGYTEIMQLLIEHGAGVDGGRNLGGVSSPLGFAAYNNQYEAAVLLLRHGAKVNPDYLPFVSSSTPALLLAVSKGHTKMARLLLDNGAEVHPRNFPSPLVDACREGHADCAKLLIERGAKVDVESQDRTPLVSAVYRGHTECAKLLLESGADVNKSHRDTGETPLMLASRYGRINDVQLLLAHGAKVNTVSSNKDTALSLACGGNHIKVAELLIKNGADVNQEMSDWDKSILLKAIQSGKPDIVSLLLKNGAKVGDGKTPLMCAVERKDIRIVEELLTFSAIVDRKSLSKALNAKSYEIVRILLHYSGERDKAAMQEIMTGFCTASKNGDYKLAEILLPYVHVPNINESDVSNSGDTPLMMVARIGHRAFVKLLLDNGAQPNVQNTNGDNALILASQGGHAECVEVLLQQEDIDVNLQNSNEHTALMVASERGHASVVQLLLEHGAELEILDTRECSALFYGVKSNSVAVVETLLAKGANASRKTVDEKTVIQYAYECGTPGKRIIKVLRARSSSHTPHPDHTTSTVVDEDSDLLPSRSKKLDGQGAAVVHVHQDAPIILPLLPSASNAPDTGRIYTDFCPAALDTSKDIQSATKCWELDSIHSTLDGTGVTIAVIDSGVNFTHVAFKNHRESSKVQVITVNDIQPGSHGTMVAFVAAGTGFSGIHRQTGRQVELKVNSGVAPNSSLMAFNVGPGESYDWNAVSWALNTLIAKKRFGGEVHVVCMSFGAKNNPTDCGQQRIKEKISALRQLGVILVAAAGNSGKYCDGVWFPACLSDVISVGTLNPTGYKHKGNPPEDIDVYAPGQDIAHPSFNSTDGIECTSGSSCAAPAVTGLVALLVQLSRKYPTPNLKVDLDYVKTVLKKDMKKKADTVLLDPQEYFQSKLKDIELECWRASKRIDVYPRNGQEMATANMDISL